MGPVLKMDASDPPGWWPVDRLITSYFALTAATILLLWARLPHPARLLGWHAAGMALLLFAIYRRSGFSHYFRHWYPVIYVAACYREMALFIVAAGRAGRDAELDRLDVRLFGVHPTIWLERIQSPALTEIMQLLYALFVPSVLLVAWLVWQRRPLEQFRYYAFLIALGFLASYFGYFLVPARGPRFLLASLQTRPLQGGWFFAALRSALDRLESAHWDCFPSGHTELTILAWWSSGMVSRRWFRVYFAYTCCIIFATVYLRYHYAVDIIAGALLAYLLILAAPHVYQFCKRRG